MLREKAQLREHVFTSSAPLIGGLIARFRAAWNNVSTRWYVRPLASQQSDFNHALLDYVLPQLSSHERRLGRYEENLPRFDELDSRLITQDGRQVDLTHDLGEIVARLVQMDRRLAEIEAGMDQRSNASSPRAEEPRAEDHEEPGR
jgi:hypothetical protein